MARSNDLDIRATADQISALFNANRSAEALAMLNERRQEQSEVVRDALDRYVGAASAGAVANQQQGRSPPRMPVRCSGCSKPRLASQ